jgi:hypothetical protein
MGASREHCRVARRAWSRNTATSRFARSLGPGRDQTVTRPQKLEVGPGPPERPVSRQNPQAVVRSQRKGLIAVQNGMWRCPAGGPGFRCFLKLPRRQTRLKPSNDSAPGSGIAENRKSSKCETKAGRHDGAFMFRCTLLKRCPPGPEYSVVPSSAMVNASGPAYRSMKCQAWVRSIVEVKFCPFAWYSYSEPFPGPRS